jgi:isoleucyl-tRNA synthetase
VGLRTQASLRFACREYADSWINNQAEDFKRLGVVADWDHRYTTMDPRYAATVLRVFGKFVHGGYVERKEKTVPWCGSCQTVLANAEIEYRCRVDPSCYVMFPLPAAYRELVISKGKHYRAHRTRTRAKALMLLFAVKGVSVHSEAEVSFLVWTTTPWTIPLNRALVLNPSGNYALLYMRWDDPADQPTATAAVSSSNAGGEAEEQLRRLFDRRYLVKQSSVLVLVGEELVEKLAALFKCRESRILAYFPAIFFERSAFKVQHPLVDNLEVRYTATTHDARTRH